VLIIIRDKRRGDEDGTKQGEEPGNAFSDAHG
jgi:hypothetical protein